MLSRIQTPEDKAAAGRSLADSSSALLNAGDYQAAGRQAAQAADLCRTSADADCESRATNTAGLAMLYRGDYAGALAAFRDSLAVCRKIADRQREIYRINNIGNVYYFQGKYLDALHQYQEAQEVLKTSTKAPWHEAMNRLTTANLAVLFQRLGREDLALDLYRGIGDSKELLPSEEARLLSNLGTLYRRLGDPFKAIGFYTKAQQLFRRERHLDGELGTVNNIAIAKAFDLQDVRGGHVALAHALSLAERASNRREALHAHLYLAELSYRQRLWDQAEDSGRSALALAKSLGTTEEEWKALYGLARISIQRGDYQQAEELLHQSIAVIESVRSRLQMTSLKADFLADKRDTYDQLMDLILDGREPGTEVVDAVLRLIERASARVFQDRIRQAETDSGKGDGHIRRLRAIRGEATEALMKRTKASGNEADALDRRINELEAEYLKVERSLPVGEAAEDSAPRFAGLASVQAALDGHTVMVVYRVTRRGLIRLWITRRWAGIDRRTFGRNEALEVAHLNAALAKPAEGNEWHVSSRRVGEMLLGQLPPFQDPNLDQLIVVADRGLASVPFEVLAAPTDALSGKLVVERYATSYLPVPSAILRGASPRRTRFPWEKQLVAFGDPVASRTAVGSVLPGDDRLLRLPSSSREITEIARLMPGRAVLYLGAEAQKRRLIDQQVRHVPVLHFSTHAAVSHDVPESSRLVFSAPETGGFDYLFLSEVYLLDLKGVDLVTLSACETERGRFVEGDGVESLGRAFLAAGARSTLTSLWRIEDSTTAEFMRQFYFEIANGSTKAEALRRAKLRFVRSAPQLTHPFYWAGFVLAGDGFAPVPRALPWGTVLFGVGGGILAAAALMPLRKTRKALPPPHST